MLVWMVKSWEFGVVGVGVVIVEFVGVGISVVLVCSGGVGVFGLNLLFWVGWGL